MRAALCAGRRLSSCQNIAASGCGQITKRAALNVGAARLCHCSRTREGVCYCCRRMMMLIPVTSLTS